MTSRSSTERPGDFSSESVVSHLVSWVLFALTYSPTCGNTVGGLGSEGDKTVIPGPKCWNPISSSKCIVLARQD